MLECPWFSCYTIKMGKMVYAGAMQEAQCGFPSPDSYMLGVSSPCTASCPVPQLPPLGSPSISAGGVPPRLCLIGQSTPAAMREAHLSLSLTQGSDVGPPFPGSQHQPPACQNARRQGLPWDGRDQHRTLGQPRAEDGKGSPGSPRRAAEGGIQTACADGTGPGAHQPTAKSSQEVPLLPAALQRGTSLWRRVTVQ